jgi:hypothetical protein
MSLLQRLVGIVLGVFFLLAVLVFTSLALGLILAVSLALWAWLWWRAGSLRKTGGTVIEGEYRDETRQHLEERDPRRL